jgi:hypothetical protein
VNWHLRAALAAVALALAACGGGEDSCAVTPAAWYTDAAGIEHALTGPEHAGLTEDELRAIAAPIAPPGVNVNVTGWAWCG